MSHKKLSWVCYPTAILLGLLFGCFLTPTGEPFDSTKWKSHTKPADDDKREAMVADLLANHSPVGLTCEEAESLLGNEYYKRNGRAKTSGFTIWAFRGVFFQAFPTNAS